MQIEGIIYVYISPSNKCYVGQTTQECRRRKVFLNVKDNYCKNGTSAIDKARRKYGVENFKYEILVQKYYSDVTIAREDLDQLEMKYIQEYDSYYNGYNATLGGKTRLGHKWTEEQKLNISGENHHGYGKKVPFKVQPKLCKSILMYDKEGVFVREYTSIKEAAKNLNLYNTNIVKVLKGKLQTTGGYRFKYKEDRW